MRQASTNLSSAHQDGKGKPRKIKLNGAGYYTNPVWSRDSKKIVYQDNSSSLYCARRRKRQDHEDRRAAIWHWPWTCRFELVARFEVDRVLHGHRGPHQPRAGSIRSNRASRSPVTDGLTEADDPVFDASGKYLYFLGSTDTGMSKHGFMQSSDDTRSPRWSLQLVVLRKDLPSPFLKETDEEKGETPRKSPRPRISSGGGDLPKTKGGDGGAAKKGEKKQGFTIDFDGIDQRILSFPIPKGTYSSLQAGSAGQVYYLASPEPSADRRGGPRGGTVTRYDLDKRKSDSVQQGVLSFELTPDGRKMLYSTGGGGGGRRGGGGGRTWTIASTGGSAPSALGGLAGGSPFAGRGSRGSRGGGPAPSSSSGGGKVLNLDAIEVKVVPQDEWKQILHEAWRVNRDFFYDPNMHGNDWPAIEKKYQQFLPHMTSGGDLYKVIRWMLSELAVGHSYTRPGERLYEHKTVKGGLLGADYEVANGRYRFKKIYGGLNWTPQLRSPLTAPGINVKAGDYLLAVNGDRSEAADRVVLALREHGRQDHRDHRRPQSRRQGQPYGDGRATGQRVRAAKHGVDRKQLAQS